jgi:hypothetical protein
VTDCHLPASSTQATTWDHLGSAHDNVELELLKAAARQRLATGQGELDLGWK